MCVNDKIMKERALFSCKPARHELKTVGFHQVFFCYILFRVVRVLSYCIISRRFFFLCLLRLVYTRYTQHSQLFPIEEEIRTAAEDQKYIKNIILENVRLLYIYIFVKMTVPHMEEPMENFLFCFGSRVGPSNWMISDGFRSVFRFSF